MSLTFPTRPTSQGRVTVGTPSRAEHCECDGPWPEEDYCVRCGRYSRASIDHTWRLRALIIAGKRKRVRSAA